ncbi:MAG: helix-turn-helix transcriptional regulator [Rhizobium sp.]|nr:helix-turn-helix transcriptional regulator [Rhizobium sp.]
MIDDEQRQLLGAFLRARREAMEPAGGGRRRTPGLRREELAQRAGISATWCAWLEQGREVQASPHALSRLAHALDLTRAERVYLFELAGRHDPEAPAPTAPVPPALSAAVAAMSCPVYGLDRFWNACCWNAAAETLFSNWLAQGPRPNLLRYIFIDPSARAFIPDWDARALRILAEFRSDYSRGRHDPEMTGLVAELTAGSAVFARGWQRQSVLAREGGLRTFRGPDGNVRPYQQHTLVPPEQPDYKLVILVPAE